MNITWEPKRKSDSVYQFFKYYISEISPCLQQSIHSSPTHHLRKAHCHHRLELLTSHQIAAGNCDMLCQQQVHFAWSTIYARVLSAIYCACTNWENNLRVIIMSLVGEVSCKYYSRVNAIWGQNLFEEMWYIGTSRPRSEIMCCQCLRTYGFMSYKCRLTRGFWGDMGNIRG